MCLHIGVNHMVNVVGDLFWSYIFYFMLSPLCLYHSHFKFCVLTDGFWPRVVLANRKMLAPFIWSPRVWALEPLLSGGESAAEECRLRSPPLSLVHIRDFSLLILGQTCLTGWHAISTITTRWQNYPDSLVSTDSLNFSIFTKIWNYRNLHQYPGGNFRQCFKLLVMNPGKVSSVSSLVFSTKVQRFP